MSSEATVKIVFDVKFSRHGEIIDSATATGVDSPSCGKAANDLYYQLRAQYPGYVIYRHRIEKI